MQTSPLDVADHDDGGRSILFECYGVAGQSALDLHEMAGKMAGGVSLDCTPAVLAVVFADIRRRVALNSPTPVTAEHMRTIGLDDALLAAALADG